MDRNILNTKFSTVRLWLFVLSHTLATFEAQFMKNLRNIRAKLKKKEFLIKKIVHCRRKSLTS